MTEQKNESTGFVLVDLSDAALESPLGAATVTPAVGDIVVDAVRTAGTYGFTVAQYHGEDNAINE